MIAVLGEDAPATDCIRPSNRTCLPYPGLVIELAFAVLAILKAVTGTNYHRSNTRSPTIRSLCASSPIPITSPQPPRQVASNSDVIFVAVKPQYVGTVLSEVRPVLQPDTVVVSIAAGVTIEKLLEAAGSDARVVRVMPNTPCLVGETAAAMCLGGQVRDEGGKGETAAICWVGR
jgi:pyrroline-5-carboxylate reductase